MEREDAPMSGGKGTQGSVAVAEPPSPAPSVVQVDAALWAEMNRKQDAMARLLEQIQAERAGGGPPPGILRPPVVATSMPANYVVWLGSEPRSGEVYLGARGRIVTVNDTTEYHKVCRDGKTIPVRGTVCGVQTGEYVDGGVTSIEFTRRCPPNHRYAGKLFAPIECPEHAAYLHLTTPDGKGHDRDGNKLYAFHLITPWIHRYEALKRFRMSTRKMTEQDVDWVASDGVEMPPEE